MKSQDTHARANGASRIQWTETARKVQKVVTGLPASLGDRMKSDPYTTLGIAAAAGVGVGIVLGSRILRMALTSAVSYAVVELARSYVRDGIPGVDGLHVPHVSEAQRATHS